MRVPLWVPILFCAGLWVLAFVGCGPDHGKKSAMPTAPVTSGVNARGDTWSETTKGTEVRTPENVTVVIKADK